MMSSAAYQRRVWKPCPTRVSTNADEVVLVDIPADDLLER